MRSSCTAAALLLAAVASSAQAQEIEDVKINQLIVYGSEQCPPSTEEEIIVCARKPEDERFRIPRDLRDDPNDPKGDSWAVRAKSFEYVGRSGIGSCTPVGPGGTIGCFDQLVREARAERANSDEVNWNRMIEEARQERLGRIDDASEAVERQLQGDE